MRPVVAPKQPKMADFLETSGEDVAHKATDELIRRERHLSRFPAPGEALSSQANPRSVGISQHVRELLALIAHRTSLVKAQTWVENQRQSDIHRFSLQTPEWQVFADKNREWWLNLPLSPTEELHLRQNLRTLDHLKHELAEVES